MDVVGHRCLRTGAVAPLLLVACAALLVGCGAGAAIAPEGGAGSFTQSSPGEQAWTVRVLELTNMERAAYGLPPVVLDDEASVVAYGHAWDMHLRGFFDHVNPDGEGPSDRLAEHGIEFRDAGENLARGHASPEEVVRAWMESPVHRANLLYPGWTRVGIAVHTGAKDGPWWAQEFYR